MSSKSSSLFSELPAWVKYAVGPLVAFVLAACCGLASLLLRTAYDPELAQIKLIVSEELNQSKQDIFNTLHPVGVAKSVQLNDLDFETASTGEPLMVYSFTLYWEGPFVKNGYTQVQVVLDCESKRYLPATVLATNGVTNTEAGQLLLDWLGFIQRTQAQAERERVQSPPIQHSGLSENY